MTPSPDWADKDATIATLLARIEALMATNERLTARVAELKAKLGLPPKTPDNSSVPPSKGQKPSEPTAAKDKAKPHAGAHRPLHPNPTSKREVFACRRQGCGADVSGVAQSRARPTTGSRIPPRLAIVVLLAIGRPATALPKPDFHRLQHASFPCAPEIPLNPSRRL